MKSSPNKLASRLAALSEAVTAMEGRGNPAVVDRAAKVATRAGQRVALSGDHTVVALAGSTGSGKSSLFNALSGTELAQVAVRRPTTSKAMAVGWGTELPNDLLDWLDVGKRHLVASDDEQLRNLVLLDLPDHDSTEEAHRVTVDRMVEMVDAIIWVVDPQKYADAALHDGYLRPLAEHADVMMVVLNQSDRLSADQLTNCVADLRALLDSEGLRTSPLMVTSAQRGDGIYNLRDSLVATVARKRAMVHRVSLDVKKSARQLAVDLGPKVPAKMNGSLKEQVTETMGDAAGVGLVVTGVRDAWRRRGAAATGWPLISWIARLRPDPLKQLRLGAMAAIEHSPTEVNRTSLPKANAVQKARVDQGLRELIDQASQGLPSGWVTAVDRAAHGRASLLADDLDTAIASTDLKVKSGAWWWVLFGLLQWLLIVTVIGGLVWWLAGPVLAASGFGIPLLVWYGLPAGLWVAIGSVLAGLLLALLGRAFVIVGAESRARRARKELNSAVSAVVEAQVFGPVQAELDRYHRAREAVREATR
ncbi:GTPase [Propionicimonas sp.]|uniref:GTPase n=1 Tax=Propionicimonas sp. TaxID=1955623 RepID=UPI001817F059|nr:GTPase [Propionicimonas sp.]MBU3977839.1 50S ribosome-binding GTPase [Actinomycetota bacterium]MBA3021936.1 ABC transporter [Propionicimonas sp.]MBU3987616.1 50S ribosome-binding GTPase [Actinomycetota bacterium]MBU4007338.1 50S ribosome-binding GTPase [Actinomycetota bacterium]MBU4065716.1 50S ribosome-binding GTPase [Actinomycetota bacterium]